RVIIAFARTKCHIGGKTFGRSQPRAFPDQQYNHFRLQQSANLVDNSHAAISHNKSSSQFPAALLGLLENQRQQRRPAPPPPLLTARLQSPPAGPVSARIPHVSSLRRLLKTFFPDPDAAGIHLSNAPVLAPQTASTAAQTSRPGRDSVPALSSPRLVPPHGPR